MTLNDLPRFRAALERMCRLHDMPAPTAQTISDWAEALNGYAIEVIEPALDTARQEAGRFHVKAAAVETVARALTRGVQATVTPGRTRYVPLYIDDAGRTLYQAEYTCGICEDAGWQPVRYDATGQTRLDELSMLTLRALEAKGRVHFRMRPCVCGAIGGQA